MSGRNGISYVHLLAYSDLGYRKWMIGVTLCMHTGHCITSSDRMSISSVHFDSFQRNAWVGNTGFV